LNSALDEDAIRLAVFQWLKEYSARYGGVLPRALLAHGIDVGGRHVTLLGPKGIWSPAGFGAVPLSITTTINGPYDDACGIDGRLVYRYRGDDPDHPDNRGLREAMKTKTPLIYFHAVEKSAYVPVWPVFIEENHPESLYCIVRTDLEYAIPGAHANTLLAGFAAEPEHEALQRYVDHVVRQRLHQGAFRARVLRAYHTSCTLCALKHAELLDAAHIIPDAEESGTPVIRNGLALCKIHHAAYDQNIIGIDPDFHAHVREDILQEVDGPMLRYGLQKMNDQTILLPAHKGDWPERDRLSERYKRFLEAG